jgi:hypothetical protein
LGHDIFDVDLLQGIAQPTKGKYFGHHSS